MIPQFIDILTGFCLHNKAPPFVRTVALVDDIPNLELFVVREIVVLTT